MSRRRFDAARLAKELPEQEAEASLIIDHHPERVSGVNLYIGRVAIGTETVVDDLESEGYEPISYDGNLVLPLMGRHLLTGDERRELRHQVLGLRAARKSLKRELHLGVGNPYIYEDPPGNLAVALEFAKGNTQGLKDEYRQVRSALTKQPFNSERVWRSKSGKQVVQQIWHITRVESEGPASHVLDILEDHGILGGQVNFRHATICDTPIQISGENMKSA